MSCQACGLAFIDRDLPEEFLTEFYGGVYRAPGSPYYINFQAALPGGKPNSRAVSQMELASKHVKLSAGDFFVDIGPGIGHSFRAAEQVFGNINKVAIELTEGAADHYARLYNAETYGAIHEFMSTGKRAKLVLMSHCLEHINPSEIEKVVHELRSMLTPEGILLVEVPNVDFKSEKKIIFQDAPHCLFFNKKSITRLFGALGWKVLFCETVGITYNDYSKKNTSGRMKHIRRLVGRTLSKLGLRASTRISSKTPAGAHANFSYGGQRVGLRIVLKPEQR